MQCFDPSDSMTSEFTEDYIRNLCVIYKDLMGFDGIDFRTSTRYCLAYYDVNELGTMYNVDGYLGMGYLTYYTSMYFLILLTWIPSNLSYYS